MRVFFGPKNNGTEFPIKQKKPDFIGLIAGDERIELPPKVLETPIIPFDQSPLTATALIYYDFAHLSTLIFVAG